MRLRGRRNDVDDGLNNTCGEGKPLREDEGEDVFGVFGLEFARGDFEVEGSDNLGYLVWVTRIFLVSVNIKRT